MGVSTSILVLLFLSCWHPGVVQAEIPTALECSWTKEDDQDPALQEMTFDIGQGPETTMVYVEPDIASFYQLQDPPSTTKVTPKFNGFQAKFINLSPDKVSLYWEDREGGTMHPMRLHKPFTASGTASFPTHRFYFTKPNDPTQILTFLLVQEYPENIYVYDPLTVPDDPVQTAENLKVLTAEERRLYDKWQKTLRFNEFYRNATGRWSVGDHDYWLRTWRKSLIHSFGLAFFCSDTILLLDRIPPSFSLLLSLFVLTGRSYLSNYLRAPPIHHMWRTCFIFAENGVLPSGGVGLFFSHRVCRCSLFAG